MEAQGGAEIRLVHIVYFLSRNGRIEHPHLLRLHHFSLHGVRLRDVKRCLAELRGKEIPESFSWSYKRRYKTGYVWQDLLDDDLITPISGNEYVLKGSEISSTSIKEEKAGQQQEQKASLHASTKPASEIEEESPSFGSETSTVMDDSGRSLGTAKQERVPSYSSFYSTFLSKKRSKKVGIDKNPEECRKSKNSSITATKMLKNLISCRGVETNNSTVAQMKKQNKPMCWSEAENVNSAALCRRDRLGGSQRVFGCPAWTQQHFTRRKSFDGIEDLSKTMTKSPVNKPNCSVCGKQFQPEKMQTHMKSCKGLKALSKRIANAAAGKGTTRV